MNNLLSNLFRGGADNAYKADEQPLIDIELVARRGARHPEREKARLVSIVNRIAENSPFGRAVLEDAARNGYKIGFESQKGSFGFCAKEDRAIMLNPRSSDDMLLATLAHEARHAQQFTNGAIDDFGVFDVRGELMYNRALEADAETAAAATCYELRLKGDTGPWRAFSKDSPEIAFGLMSKQSKDGKITTPMLQSAFEGWYKNECIVEGYEEGYVQDVMTCAMKDQNEGSLPYDGKVSSPDVVAMICKDSDRNCYWADRPNILDSPEKLSVCAETVNTADRFFKSREERCGMKPDTSYKTLLVRDPENLDSQRASDRPQHNCLFGPARLQAARRQR